VVLAVVLILLLVMTVLAIASLSSTLMEERMGTAQYDRSLAFQAAEAAMREAEEVARGKPALPGGGAVGAGCANGLCARPDLADPGERQRWMNDGFWAEGSGFWAQANVAVSDLALQPRYIIELLDDAVQDDKICTTGGDVSLEANCTMLSSRYRITVRTPEAPGRASVTLQSIYAVP
jgi:type IV pilus assembly protein PilX